MAKEIKLPKVSMGQTEGSISEWLVKEGAWVEKDQLVMLMETEKVSYELEAPEAGFAVFQVELEEIVACGTTVILMAQTEEELKILLENKETQSNSGSSVSIPVNNNQAEKSQVQEIVPESLSVLADSNYKSQKIKITPVAKKKAQLHNLDISRLTGTGPNGRIKICDVDACINQTGSNIQSINQSLQSTYSMAGIDRTVKHTIPLKGIRKSVAEQMVYSLHVAAQTSFMGEVDMTRIIKLRKRINKTIEESGDKISFNDLLVYTMSRAIPKVPIVNSSLIDNEIKVWEDINIGLAVAIELNEYESGLYVPVVKNADKKTLLEISRETKLMIKKALNNELSSTDTSDGTITLSPLGTVVEGYSTSTPVILQPQAYIINSGAIVERVVPRKGKLKIRSIMTLSMTFDHRIMDGVPALKYFNVMKQFLENPETLLL